MKFIFNSYQCNHLDNLIPLIENADELLIATAFLKMSGLLKLQASIDQIVECGSSVIIIAGQHYGLTEPKALKALYKQFKGNSKCKLYLANATHKNHVFHPKLYLIRSGNDCTILSGSANITEGGLVNNTECSIILNTTQDDEVWKEAVSYYQTLLADEYSQEATLLSIGKYEKFYNEQKLNNKKVKAIPPKNKKQLEFNYQNLLNHLNNYSKDQREQDFIKRSQDYNDARVKLDIIADSSTLTQDEFAGLLDSLVGSKDKDNLWHSGSLHRNRKDVYSYYKQFRDLVRYIRDNRNSNPSDVFTNAKSLIGNIQGAGINYLTEIMITYNPDKFALLNNNPLTVLKSEGGVNLKSYPSSFSGAEYSDFCDLIDEISKHLEFRNMLEADSFFNNIYWKIKGKNHEKLL